MDEVEDTSERFRSLGDGTSRLTVTAKFVGPEHGTHALIAVVVEAGTVVKWERLKSTITKVAHAPMDYPPCYRLTLPTMTAWLCGSRFRELFPDAD